MACRLMCSLNTFDLCVDLKAVNLVRRSAAPWNVLSGASESDVIREAYSDGSVGDVWWLVVGGWCVRGERAVDRVAVDGIGGNDRLDAQKWG